MGLLRNSEVGLELEAKGSSFLASKLELGEVWKLGSLKGPLSQILFPRVVVVFLSGFVVLVLGFVMCLLGGCAEAATIRVWGGMTR